MSLSKATIAALAAAGEAYASPYAHLAAELATSMSAAKAQTDRAKAERTSVWDGFKSAMSIALENGHSAAALRAGLEIACTNAGIPAGSFRGYVGTIGNLYADVCKAEGEEGHLALEAALEISVKDARERYKPEPSNLEKLRKALAERTKDWNEEELAVLLSIVDDTNADKAPKTTEEEASEEEVEQATIAQAA